MSERTKMYEEAPEGFHAHSPFRLTLRGWWRTTKRIVVALGRDNLALVAAGIAFYGLLSIFPALAGLVSLYGLIASPQNVFDLIQAARGVLPADFASLLVEQLRALTESDQSALSVGAIVGLALSVWSANRATKALFSGLNIAYEQPEGRNLIQLNLASLGITLLALVLAAVAVPVVAVVPVTHLSDRWPVVVDVLRFAGLAIVFLMSLAVLYRVGPNRRSPRWQWVSVGSVLATVLWVLGCAGFSLYVETFGSFNETFGAIAGVAISMTWLWMTAFLVLFGAEVNAELEHETLADSTVGPKKPIGERGAFVADDVPEGVRNALEGR